MFVHNRGVLTSRSARRTASRRFSPRRTAPIAALAATVLLAIAACGDGTSSDADTGGSSGPGKVKVIGAFYPVAWLGEQIGGSHVSVDTLTKPGAEPHDLELTPRQIGKLSEAEFVVYVMGVQPAVDEAVRQRAKDHGLDATSVVKTLAPPAGDEEAAKEKLSFDPHVWVDPGRMITIATAVGDRLATTDPAHAADYKSGARTLTAKLTALDGEFQTGLKTCEQKTIVTSHAAFGYLADHYGLRQVSIAGIDPENEPSPRRLAELTKEIRQNGATTVFTETLVSPKVAQTLAREAGVKTATLDPVEGVAEGSRDDYLSIMRQNLQTLRTALSCS